MAVALLRRLVDLHRAQVAGIVEAKGVGGIKRLYSDSRAELEEKLRRLVRAGKGETFTAQHLRLVLAQVSDVTQQLESGMADHLAGAGRLAAEVAPRGVVNMVTEMEKRYGNMTPVVQAQQAAVLSRVYKGVTPSLLNRYPSSVRTYGTQTIAAIRQGLARSIVQAESVEDAVDRVSGAAGLFARQRWRAERIVRTELAYTTGFATHESIKALRPTVPQIMKRLIATRDDREGDDSKELDGQTVPVDQPFIWEVADSRGNPTGQVVRYMHPPNRPNDREVEIPWLASWGSSDRPVASAGEVTPRTPS